MEDYLPRKEHEEFCKRMESENKRLEDEDNRQNHRLDLLENNSKQLAALVTSTEKLALSMESMAKEMEAQGKRLETLESRDGVEKLSADVDIVLKEHEEYEKRLKVLEGRDGEKWRTVVSHIVTAVVGAVICYIFSLIGM